MNSAPRPRHPYLVALVALLLPGCGQILNNQPARGLRFVFFTLLLGWITYHLTTPGHSFLARYAGGLFVYSLSVLDAYKWARVRWEVIKLQNSNKP
ncbi:MAG: hypothetical protein ACT4NU_01640 [Chromatiales bacterium]